MKKVQSHKNIITALAFSGAAYVGYCRKSYAACSLVSGSSYLCSDISSAQTINADNAAVSTGLGFSGDGIEIYGDGALSFTDENNSTLANDPSTYSGLDIRVNGDDGGIAGSINIQSNGLISSDEEGIYSLNNGSGTTTMVIAGDIYTGYRGILSINNASTSTISITTTSTSKIDLSATPNNYDTGISIINNGLGESLLEVSGDIYTSNRAISVSNGLSSSNISITTTNSSKITSSKTGISVKNGGNGATTLSISGDITSQSKSAIYIEKSGSTANITIQNGAEISGNKAISSKDSNNVAFNVTLDGSANAVSIIGTSGTAIEFDDSNDELTLSGELSINGDVNLRGGTDNIALNNANLTLAENSNFTNFESITVSGDNVLTGSFDFSGIDLATTSDSSLKINGSITANQISIAENSTLSGNHTINLNEGSNLIATNGAVISPGNSIGTINVIGGITFNSGSTLDVEVNNTGADKLTATEAITIDAGATLNITTNNFDSGSATILESGTGINGTFDNIVKNDGPNVTLLYQDNNLNLSFVTLDSSVFSSQIQSSLNSSILFSDSLTNRISSSAFSAKKNNMWVENLYRQQSLDSQNSQMGSNSNAYGIAIGADTAINNNYRLGISLATISDQTTIKGAQGRRDGEATMISAYGIYSTAKNNTKNPKFFTSLSLGVGFHDNQNQRLVVNEGINSYATSTSSDNDIKATIQSGVKVNLNDLYSAVFKLSASYIKTNSGGFDEQNGGASNVKIYEHNFSSLKTRESIRLEQNKPISLFAKYQLAPYFEIGLSQEEALGSRNINGQFSNKTQFTTAIDSSNRSFVTTALGANAKISKNITAFISCENSSSSKQDRKDFRFGAAVLF